MDETWYLVKLTAHFMRLLPVFFLAGMAAVDDSLAATAAGSSICWHFNPTESALAWHFGF